MLLVPLLALTLTQAPLTTEAERSDFTRTGRYAEVERLCQAFPRRYPGRVACTRFGITPEGRPMLALVASEDGALSPEKARARGRPVVLFQGGIHAGEIDGKDAGFWLLRDVLERKALPGVLRRVTAVFVPVFNVDGHERFGPNHRPNQRGPESMGWRVTAQNLNLNRDYVKADAPEMRQLLALLGAWDPLVYLDLHVTDGAQFEPDVAVQVEPLQGGPASLRPAGKALSAAVLEGLGRQGHLATPYYPSFLQDDDPKSGFALGAAPPRFSQSYWAARNRFGILVETHAWKPYAHRVATTRHVLEHTLTYVAEHARALQDAAAHADSQAARGQARETVLAWERGPRVESLEFRGYAYERKVSPLFDRPVVAYDESRPQVWRVPYFPDVRPAASVTLPQGGYLVPAPHAAWVAERLRAHGVRFHVLSRALPEREVEAFRASRVKFGAQSFEGHQPLKVEGAWARERLGAGAGSLYVPAAQPRALLVAHLLEPSGPDSLLAWGFFNTHFEQKEYVEDYVLEPFARELLARDPAVRAAWEERLEDPAFAADPQARVRFFLERHPARDTAQNLYPVLRLDAPPPDLRAPARAAP